MQRGEPLWGEAGGCRVLRAWCPRCTQTLIYGMVANFYRTAVRSAGVAWCAGFGRRGVVRRLRPAWRGAPASAGVAWCAGFGRLGGVTGPVLGGYLAGGGFALETIFYILASVAVLGSVLTTPVQSSRNRRRHLLADA